MEFDLMALFLKGFVAFVVTFAWAYVLYPLATLSPA
jgi:hypothetical protein